MCADDKARNAWVNRKPEGKQERADTWAFAVDGSPSAEVKIPREGSTGAAHSNPVEID